MERHPEKLSEGVVRKNGELTPFNAGDAVAAVCDLYGSPIPSSIKPRLGKAAKGLLEDGFHPSVICRALLLAVRKGRPDLVDQFALDVQNADKGEYLTWDRYQQEIKSYNRSQRADLEPIRRALRKEFGL